MVTAKVRFLTNSLMAELTCKSDELKKSLEEMGVLTPLSLIKLDNARTLQIQLTPDDNIGELICGIVNPRSDTLGNVQRLCRFAYCMNEQHKESFIKKLENGDIKSVSQGLKEAEKMRADKSYSR